MTQLFDLVAYLSLIVFVEIHQVLVVITSIVRLLQQPYMTDAF